MYYLHVDIVVSPQSFSQNILAKAESLSIDFGEDVDVEGPAVVGGGEHHVSLVRAEVKVGVVCVVQTAGPIEGRRVGLGKLSKKRKNISTS